MSFKGCACGYVRSKKSPFSTLTPTSGVTAPLTAWQSAEEVHHHKVVLSSLTFSCSVLVIFRCKATLFSKGKNSQHANSLGICFDSVTLAA